MKQPKVFKYPNRLAKTLTQPTGLRQQEAIHRAKTALEPVREMTLADLTAAVREIVALGEKLNGSSDPEVLDAIYDRSNGIIATAGIFGLEEMGQAAWSLCELLSRFEAAGRCDPRMVAVHVEALRVLRNPDQQSKEQRAAMLEGLRQVTQSVT